MSGYEVFFVIVLLLWPIAIAGLLVVMHRLEKFVERTGGETPEQAGVEPVAGTTGDPEVRVVFGAEVVGEETPSAPERPEAPRRGRHETGPSTLGSACGPDRREAEQRAPRAGE